MDYEKLYKEALERARQFSEHPLQEDSANIVEYIFPELKESEDERMKKELIKFLQECHNIDSGFFSRYCEIPFTQMLAWLEKQGEKSQRIISAEAKEALYNKPALSEEDEELHIASIGYLCNLRDSFEAQKWDKKPVQRCINWLLSFKQRMGG